MIYLVANVSGTVFWSTERPVRYDQHVKLWETEENLLQPFPKDLATQICGKELSWIDEPFVVDISNVWYHRKTLYGVFETFTNCEAEYLESIFTDKSAAIQRCSNLNKFSSNGCSYEVQEEKVDFFKPTADLFVEVYIGKNLEVSTSKMFDREFMTEEQLINHQRNFVRVHGDSSFTLYTIVKSKDEAETQATYFMAKCNSGEYSEYINDNTYGIYLDTNEVISWMVEKG